MLSYGAMENPFSQDFFSVIHDTSIPVSKQPKEEIWNRIEEEAKKMNQPAKNAKIDTVWKKIPGLNGILVDVEKSYDKMKKRGKYNQSLLVINQKKPDVQLKDLPPSPIYRGHPEQAVIALNINVSWGEEYIPDMLNTLKKHNVKATFFIEGKWANEHVEIVKMIQEQGHVIANHAYNHPDMRNITSEEVERQLKQTNDILKRITGKQPTLFAPPSGSYNEEVVRIANHLQMETILWSVDTIDWKKPTTEVLLNRVLTKVHNGAFILMHPTASTSQALEPLILKIRDKKYKITTVDNILNGKRITLDIQ